MTDAVHVGEEGYGCMSEEEQVVLEIMELGQKHFPGVGPERDAAHPAQTVLLTTNHETVEVKVAPIERDLEQLG